MAHSEEAFLITFAAWQVALRKRLRMTQVELGEFLDIYPEAISRWENAVQAASAQNLLRLMGLATEQERTALIEKSMDGLDDTVRTGMGDTLVCCTECNRELRIRDYTTAGWPAPPTRRREDDPYAIRVCVECSIKYGWPSDAP